MALWHMGITIAKLRLDAAPRSHSNHHRVRLYRSAGDGCRLRQGPQGTADKTEFEVDKVYERGPRRCTSAWIRPR